MDWKWRPSSFHPLLGRKPGHSEYSSPINVETDPWTISTPLLCFQFRSCSLERWRQIWHTASDHSLRFREKRGQSHAQCCRRETRWWIFLVFPIWNPIRSCWNWKIEIWLSFIWDSDVLPFNGHATSLIVHKLRYQNINCIIFWETTVLVIQIHGLGFGTTGQVFNSIYHREIIHQICDILSNFFPQIWLCWTAKDSQEQQENCWRFPHDYSLLNSKIQLWFKLKNELTFIRTLKIIGSGKLIVEVYEQSTVFTTSNYSA